MKSSSNIASWKRERRKKIFVDGEKNTHQANEKIIMKKSTKKNSHLLSTRACARARDAHIIIRHRDDLIISIESRSNNSVSYRMASLVSRIYMPTKSSLSLSLTHSLTKFYTARYTQKNDFFC